MNIFYLDKNPAECAKMHNDKHCIKMILEYAQLLSTAHRVLDGNQGVEQRYVAGSFPVRWRSVKVWKLDDERNKTLYAATHINHPSAIWVRESLSNYMWLSHLLVELCKEYTYRYGKVHKCEEIGLVNMLLNVVPTNIPNAKFTEPTPAMPDEYKVDNDSIQSYHNYYVRGKQHLAEWKGKINSRETPKWYSMGCLDLMAEDAQKLGLGY